MKKIYCFLIILSCFSLIVKGQQHFEKSFKVHFPHAVANQTAYINFPTNIDVWGSILVEISGGYNNQKNIGYLAKRFMIIKNANAYFDNMTEIVDASGPLADQWNIGEFDSETYKIPIYHLAATGNDIVVKVSGQLVHASSIQPIQTNMSISSPVVLSHGKARQYKSIMQDRMGIGTGNPDYTLDVVGKIRAHELLVNTNKTADFVFEEDYKLLELAKVKEYIKEHKHLPDIPSAEEMKKNGVSVSDLQVNLLQKIEELTLHVIKQQEELNNIKTELEAIKKRD